MRLQHTGDITLDDAFLDALADRLAARLRDDPLAGNEPWIDTEGAATHLACDPRRIRDLVSLGRLPHRRDGRRLLFRRSELDAALDRPA